MFGVLRLECLMPRFSVVIRSLLVLVIAAGLTGTIPGRPATAAPPGNPFFQQTWQRTDAPVLGGYAVDRRHRGEGTCWQP